VGRLYGTALTLGNNSNVASPIAPSYVTFRGINWNGQIFQAGDPNVGYVVFDGGHVWDVDNQENGLFEEGAGTGNVIENMDIGPGCCSNDAIDAGTVLPDGTVEPQGLTIRNNTIHDFTVTCVGNPDQSCDNSRSGCTWYFDNGCNHPDGTQILSGNNVSVVDNKYYGAGCQAIFVATGDGTRGMFTGNWLIAGNMIDEMTQCNDSQKAIAVGGLCDSNGDPDATGRACWTGDLKIVHNTIWESEGIAVGTGGPSPGANNIYANSFTAEIAGNLIVGAGYDFGPPNGDGCTLRRADGRPFSPTFRHNVVAPGARTCGSDVAAQARLVDPGTAMRPDLANQAAAGASTGGIDLRLAPSDQAAVADVGATASCDQRRPGPTCDVGAARTSP
jgi:hypothetical protein